MGRCEQRRQGSPEYRSRLVVKEIKINKREDLFAATPIHRLLQALLDLPVPRWHHHRLLVDASGQKLAKRRGSPSLADRREAGEDGLLLAEQLRLHRFPGGISLASA